MGLIKNLKVMKDAIAQGLSGAGPTAEQLAALSPEQRAAYEQQMAIAAQSQHEAAAVQQSAILSRPLHGPAGEWVHGPATATALTPGQLGSMSGGAQIEHSMQVAKGQFKDALRNPFGATRPAPLPASAPTGTVDRDRQAAIERAARDHARVPYRAPHGAPVRFVRLATRGATQVEEVAAYLASSGLAGRPDLVYGVSRVPDRISPALSTHEGGRVVEWDVVHAAESALPPAALPSVTWFDGASTWVARRAGEPAVVDEDLALAHLAAAGIPPEHTLGIARQLAISKIGGGDDGDSGQVLSQVLGVLTIHAGSAGAETAQQMVAARPFALAAGPPAGVHLEVLNWGAVAAAVHPSSGALIPIPSPFPYLPTTGQELMRAYIEVVGVYPGDCCSAQVTEDAPRDLTSRRVTSVGMTMSSNLGVNQVCADGKERRRLFGGSLVVLAYRDRPEYQVGRQRWAAYQRDVLQASLGNGLSLREPVSHPLDAVPGVLRGVVAAAERIDAVLDAGNDGRWRIPPHRYCWPLRS